MSFVHSISPVLLDLGPLQIRWYGFIYALGFVLAYLWLWFLIKRHGLKMRLEDVDSFFLYLIPSVVIGARLFEIVFFEPGFYFANPLQMLAIWNGGLSFHGGLAGAVFAVWLFLRNHPAIEFYELADALVVPAAFALFLGRIANFINGELWGTLTDVPWCVYFPGVEGCRHPSQLYEAAKNFLIGIVLLVVGNREREHARARANVKHKQGCLFWLFVLIYGILRFLVNFFRDDPAVLFGLQMGQLLSLAMVIVAGMMLWRMHRLNKQTKTKASNK